MLYKSYTHIYMDIYYSFAYTFKPIFKFHLAILILLFTCKFYIYLYLTLRIFFFALETIVLLVNKVMHTLKYPPFCLCHYSLLAKLLTSFALALKQIIVSFSVAIFCFFEEICKIFKLEVKEFAYLNM